MTNAPAAAYANFLKREYVKSALLCGILILVNVLIFLPSLIRVFVEDQILYLAQLNGAHDLGAGLKLCDYNLARIYMKGDEILYRPLLFAWLALENTILQNDHVYWNAMNLVLHCGVALLLWRLLESIHSSVFSFLFAL